MRQNDPKPGSGQQLVADFQTAFVSAATVEAAKYEAARSEDALVSQLTAVSNGSYLRPGYLDDDAQTRMTHDSLDAHIKKVQVSQLESMNAAQLQQLMYDDNHTYHNRKVEVTMLHDQKGVIESIWFNKYTGYRSGTVKKRRISGIIDQVLLDKNTLVLRPSKSAQLFNGELQNYLVYIIDPETLMPMVSLNLS
jgi:hypothetical protein